MASHTATINFPGGEIDIDTEEDLRKIRTIVGKPPRK
jgi:2-phospho-L-lactate guanylyltransferase (CobY/MobA/RfbA family)